MPLCLWGCRLRGRRVVAAVGQRLPELAARGDVELGEGLGHVVFDGVYSVPESTAAGSNRPAPW